MLVRGTRSVTPSFQRTETRSAHGTSQARAPWCAMSWHPHRLLSGRNKCASTLPHFRCKLSSDSHVFKSSKPVRNICIARQGFSEGNILAFINSSRRHEPKICPLPAACEGKDAHQQLACWEFETTDDDQVFPRSVQGCRASWGTEPPYHGRVVLNLASLP
jgi:hypothetical protein